VGRLLVDLAPFYNFVVDHFCLGLLDLDIKRAWLRNQLQRNHAGKPGASICVSRDNLFESAHTALSGVGLLSLTSQMAITFEDEAGLLAHVDVVFVLPTNTASFPGPQASVWGPSENFSR
jgi:hypothetical protein